MIADKAFRLALNESQAIIIRNLRAVAERAEKALQWLRGLEVVG